MKKNEVPQHDEGLMDGHKIDVCYVVDENGKYTTVQSSGWEPKNAAMKQAWEVVNEGIEETRQQVLKGELSPIAFFMEKELMDIKILSQYTGFSKRKIRRHLKPKNFSKLDDTTIQKYAEVFEISTKQLRTFSGTETADEG